jgi:hypothetical protein
VRVSEVRLATLDAIRTAALALSRAIEPADLPPHARMALLALRVALGPESVAVPETGDDR